MGLNNRRYRRKPIRYDQFSDFARATEGQQLTELPQLMGGDAVPSGAIPLGGTTSTGATGSGAIYTVPQGKKFILKSVSQYIREATAANRSSSFLYITVPSTAGVQSINLITLDHNAGTNASFQALSFNSLILPSGSTISESVTEGNAVLVNSSYFGYEF